MYNLYIYPMKDGWLDVFKLITDRSTCCTILERNRKCHVRCVFRVQPKGNVFMYVRCVWECVWMKENTMSRRCMIVNNVYKKLILVNTWVIKRKVFDWLVCLLLCQSDHTICFSTVHHLCVPLALSPVFTVPLCERVWENLG